MEQLYGAIYYGGRKTGFGGCWLPTIRSLEQYNGTSILFATIYQISVIQSSESNRFYVSALSGGNTASIIRHTVDATYNKISDLDSPFMSIQAVYVVLFAPRVDMVCAEASSK